jgi:peptidoglycan/LPS O-acetylase OafA/YrhL
LKATTGKILEIQGLRALAAILVLIFHAKFIPGGFIGVDIFYVISGFLINGLLLK